MKNIRKNMSIAALLLTVMLVGCANSVLPGEMTTNISSTNSAPSLTVDESETASEEKNIEIEYGKIYYPEEWSPIYEAIWQEGHEIYESNYKSMVLDAIENGKYPQTMTLTLNGIELEGYVREPAMKGGAYNYIPFIMYRTQGFGFSSTIDVATMGMMKTFNFVNTEIVPISGKEKVTKEEIVEIAKEEMKPFLDYWGLDATTDISKSGNTKHSDGLCDVFGVDFTYVDKLNTNYQFAYVLVDEYGCIVNLSFVAPSVTKKELELLPDLDTEMLKELIETKREEKCDCEMVLWTQSQKYIYQGKWIVVVSINVDSTRMTIPTDHIHDYINSPSFHIVFPLE